MAEIRKMSIQGIRAFSPFESKTIKFFKPLTIIVGDNGCGKTTIIECLKIGCTGGLPPNTSNGQSFVSDPTLSHQEEVKGQIKMEFLSQDGKTVLCIRSYSLRVNKGKLMFKSLDQTLSIVDQHGMSNAISNRGRDIDVFIPQMLGMSRAIIENVIFCHQDEANWPLADSRELKKRFDSIFESTFYTKSLEAIRKEKKDKKDELTEAEKDEIDKKNKYVQAQKIHREMTQIESEIALCQESLTKLKELLVLQKEKKTDVDQKVQKYSQIEQAIKYCESELAKQTNRCDSLRQSLSEQLDITEDEMKNELSLIEANSAKSTYEMDSVSQQKKQVEKQLEQVIRVLNSDLQLSAGKRAVLSNNLTKFQLHLKQLIPILDETSQKDLQSLLECSVVTNEQWERCLHVLEETKMKKEQELAVLKEQTHSAQLELTVAQQQLKQKEVEEGAAQRAIENELRSAEDALAATRDLLRTTEQRLAMIQPREDMSYEELIEREKQSLESNRQSLQTTENQIKTLETSSQLSQKQEEWKQAQQAHLEARKAYENAWRRQSRVPSSSLHEHMKERRQQAETMCIQALQEAGYPYSQADSPSIWLQNQFTTLTQSITGLRVDVRRGKQEWEELNHSLGCVEGQLTTLKQQKENLQNQIESLQAEIQMEYMELGIQEQLSDEGYSSVINNLVYHNDSTTKQIPLSTSVLTTLSKHYLVLQLQEQDCMLIPQIDSLSKQMTTMQKKVHAKQMMLESAQTKLTKLEGILKEFDVWRIRCLDVDELKEDVADEGGVDLKQLEKEVEKTKQREEELMICVQTCTREEMRERQRLQSEYDELNRQVKKNEDCLRDYHQAMRNSETWKEEYEKYAALCEERESHVNELKQKKEDLARNDRGSVVMSEYQTAVTMKMNELRSRERIMMDAETILEKLQREREMIEGLGLVEIQQEIQSLTEKLEVETQKKEELETSLHSLELTLNSLHAQTDSVRLRIAVLKANLQLMTETKAISAMTDKLNSLRNQQIAVNIDTLLKDQNTLEMSIHQNSAKLSQAEGEIRQLQKRREMCMCDLNSQEYANIDRRYVLTQTRVRLLTQVIRDLEVYSRGIEEALLQYHQTKIKEINERISELWSQTYQGRDIESIEIESKSIIRGNKKQFEYSVFMIKNHSRLQMRSRCSAGQKALAALVIRMALAESFCTGCGMLALDEPTTNLDQENKVALVYSLVQIIKYRKEQRNFQLVVITHDDEFGRLLTQADLGDHMYYYRISREESSHVPGLYVSNIARQSWS